MAAFQPFTPAMTGGTVGLTQAVVMTSGTPTAGSGTLAAAPGANALLVINGSTLVAFVRVCTTPSLTATSSDVPIQPFNGGGGRILAMPSNTPVYVYAVPQATLGANANVYFTPGQGGIE